ncbi:MAG: DNA-processing protein DprA [bacterium]|nr:DNA-processing protein DprA [bacterium]
MIDEAGKLWLGLWLVPGVGPRKIATLMEHIGGIEQIYRAGTAALCAAGLNDLQARAVQQAPESQELADEVARIEEKGLNLVHIEQAEYPQLLRHLSDAPPVLYLKGNHDFNQGLHLGFVGSRKASHQGKDYTAKLIARLAQLVPDLTVVSGLALGIDAAAHRAALDHGLKTLGVLGHGLGWLYPPQNRELAEEMCQQGALVTEFPVSTRSQAAHFPLRNRIVAGICRGILVVEAGERSGASITANLALEQGRDVWALPGPPDSPFCRGSNRMIQQGRARLVMDAEDMLEEILPQVAAEAAAKSPRAAVAPSADPSLEPDEAALLEVLSAGPLQQDQLASKLDLNTPKLLGLLTAMEMKGLVAVRTGGLVEAALR